eukprot:gb/GECG01010975.1/.p1 GENE.gb/GECG01010975.1/~~gb/GECG01010975.1/.p1  ORF type:complete len:332 (+),score=20.57 gb/GECG01010975.1/:1-996(+)
MVGTTNQTIDFISGGIAGACAIAVSQPLDYARVILATQRSKVYQTLLASGEHISISRLLTNSIQQFGIKKLFRGMSLPVCAQVTRGSLGFLVFGTINRWFKRGDPGTHKGHSHSKQNLKHSLLSGTAAGILTCLTLHPTERIKVLMQVSNSSTKNTRALTTFAQVYRQLGILGLFRGFTAVFPMDIISGALYFGGNDILKAEMGRNQGKESNALNVPTLMFCGITCGMLSWIAIYPLDIIRNRMMASQDHKVSFLKTAREIFHANGLRGFYRGLAPTLLRVLPHDAVLFTVYGLISRNLKMLTEEPSVKIPLADDPRNPAQIAQEFEASAV